MTINSNPTLVKLSPRLSALSGFIERGESIADIGTDHAQLPIYLRQTGICSHVVLCDVKLGPISKAKENINLYAPNFKFDLRLGDGFSVIDTGEVDSAVIAGMGGLLLINILEADIIKTKSIKKLILQPRKDKALLVKWLLTNNFDITDETLVKEGRNICEILVAIPFLDDTSKRIFVVNDPLWDYEISPILLNKKDPLLKEFISRKILTEKKIIKSIMDSRNSTANSDKQRKAETRMIKLIEFFNILKESEK